MLFSRNKILVDTDWLAKRLGTGEVLLLDASWHLPPGGRSAKAEYETAHIEGAQFFDHEAIADPESLLPNTLPSEDHFAAAASALGISNDHTVVVYDTGGLHAATRAWWMFRAFGHEKTHILDGGLTKWQAEGREVASGPAESAPRHFKASLDHEILRSADDLISNLKTNIEQIVDARGAARFKGDGGEPREGMRAGHIPASVNVPYSSIYNEDGTVKDKKALKELFSSADVDLKKPLVASCGSGMTATSLILALAIIGKDDVALYDGSWAEWGALGDEAPVEQG